MPRTPDTGVFRDAILALLDARGPGKTVCPSEVARFVAHSDRRADWAPLMQSVRDAASDLAHEGIVAATQRGRIVDSATARGPIRLRHR